MKWTIIRALRATGSDGATVRELMAAHGFRDKAVRRGLTVAARRGLAARGCARRWWATEFAPDDIETATREPPGWPPEQVEADRRAEARELSDLDLAARLGWGCVDA